MCTGVCSVQRLSLGRFQFKLTCQLSLNKILKTGGYKTHEESSIQMILRRVVSLKSTNASQYYVASSSGLKNKPRKTQREAYKKQSSHLHPGFLLALFSELEC